jgi:hypothetical protein
MRSHCLRLNQKAVSVRFSGTRLADVQNSKGQASTSLSLAFLFAHVLRYAVLLRSHSIIARGS